MTPQAPLGLREIFGLDPLPVRAREAWRALRGDGNVPRTRFGTSSLQILDPALALRTWMGKRREDGRIPIYNLVNRTPTPLTEGWSIRKTQVRDFRGGALTYDSHNGTDFAVPVGTVVVAPAAGRVLRISSELDRGGLKLFLDHGRGLMTTQNHLGRALVAVGDVVRRGQPIALSAYSGIDALVAFPWSVPHVHFNVWLDGEYTDPFAVAGEVPLWREGNDPRPPAGEEDEAYEPTRWDEGALAATIAACRDEAVRAELLAEPDLHLRAMNALFQRNYYPARFSASPPPLVAGSHPREPRLSLPFRREDWSGVAFDR